MYKTPFKIGLKSSNRPNTYFPSIPRLHKKYVLWKSGQSQIKVLCKYRAQEI